MNELAGAKEILAAISAYTRSESEEKIKNELRSEIHRTEKEGTRKARHQLEG